MSKFNVLKEGLRVVVQIAKPETFAGGAAESMNGRAGVIEKVREDYVKWPVSAHGFLVLFDEPAPAWHNHSMPHTAFWFEAQDLRPEGA